MDHLQIIEWLEEKKVEITITRWSEMNWKPSERWHVDFEIKTPTLNLKIKRSGASFEEVLEEAYLDLFKVFDVGLPPEIRAP